MEPFEEAVRTGDAAAVRALLTKQPELRAALDRPAFDTAPAIVFSRHDRAMVDTLLDFGADINSRSQFWGLAEFPAPGRRLSGRRRALLQAGARRSSTDFGSEAVQGVLRRHAAGSGE